jgi:hypothetical protein
VANSFLKHTPHVVLLQVFEVVGSGMPNTLSIRAREDSQADMSSLVIEFGEKSAEHIWSSLALLDNNRKSVMKKSRPQAKKKRLYTTPSTLADRHWSTVWTCQEVLLIKCSIGVLFLPTNDPTSLIVLWFSRKLGGRTEHGFGFRGLWTGEQP